MNKQYRVIFNHQRGEFMVVSEDTHAQGKSSCRSQVANNKGEVALTAVIAATAIGAGLMATPAVADTWNVTANNGYTNTTSGTTGTYDNKFFKPGTAPKYKGSAGFFDAQGATTAVDIVTGKSGVDSTKYKEAKVDLGAENDTTNLQNMKTSLDIVRRTNELRAGEGRSALKISHELMALSQVSTDWARYKVEHSGIAGWENLAWDFSAKDAVDSWYAEKELCPNGADNCQWNTSNGHYLNMMSAATVTGAAYGATYTGYGNGTQGAAYGYGSDGIDVNEYAKLLDDYIATGGWTYLNENQTVNVAENLGNDHPKRCGSRRSVWGVFRRE